MTIPPGGTQGAFTVVAMPLVDVSTALDVAGSVITTLHTTLTATPIFQSLTINPPSIMGGTGQNATATITLTATLRGGVVVLLGLQSGSPNPGLIFSGTPNGGFQSSIVIPQGESSGTFYIRSAGVSSPVTATIYAWIPVQQYAAVTVNPGFSDPDLGRCGDCNATAGLPINLTNGNVWVQQSDYSLPGLAGGIEIARTWNSKWEISSPLEVSGMFGRGWRSTYEERLVTGTVLKYWRADGSLWQFLYDSVSQTYTLIAPTHERATLAFDSGTTLFTLTFADGTKKQFNNAGYLTALIDRNGNQTTIAYDGSNRIAQITDAAGRTLTFNYPGSSRQVQTMQGPSGTVATYAFDSGFRLTQVTYADGSFLAFSYDANHMLLDVKDTNAKILEAHAYDGSRRGLSSQRANGVQNVTVAYTSSTSTRVTDSLSNVTDYTFEQDGARNWITQINGPGCSACGGRGNATFTYDPLGRRTRSTDALGRNTDYAYDAFNNLASRSVQLDPQTTLTWSYTYNSLGQVLTATDPLGNVTTNNYDPNGNLLSITTPSPDGVAAGSTTSFTYDAKGQLTRVTDPRGNQTNIAYTTAGLVQTITDAMSNVTTYAYDTLNRLTTLTPPSAFTTGSFGFSYDALSRRTQMTRPNNVTTDYTYDNLSRLLSVLHKLSGGTIDGASYTVDAVGNRTAKANLLPSGPVENYTYDAIYQLAQVVQNGSTTTESYTYDPAGNRLNSLGVSPYAYNVSNQLTSTPTATFTYDANGNTLTKRTGQGRQPTPGILRIV